MRRIPHNTIEIIFSGLRLGTILCLVSCTSPRYGWDMDCVGCSSPTAEEAAEMNEKIHKIAANPNPNDIIWQGPSDDTAGLQRALAKSFSERQPGKTDP